MIPSWQKLACISSIAILAVPSKIVSAAMTVNCTQGISYGIFLPQCNGSITVQATAASGTINNGCHSQVGGVMRAGICNVVTTALPTATMDARITFTTPNVTFSNTMGAGLITVDNYRLQTGGGSALNTFTYNSTLLNPTHTFKIGGRLRFNNGETLGVYNTNLNLCVTAIP